MLHDWLLITILHGKSRQCIYAECERQPPICEGKKRKEKKKNYVCGVQPVHVIHKSFSPIRINLFNGKAKIQVPICLLNLKPRFEGELCFNQFPMTSQSSLLATQQKNYFRVSLYATHSTQ